MTSTPHRLIGMREPEYKRLRRKIQAECDEKLKALDLVYRMSGGMSKRDDQNGRSSKGVVSRAVRNALQRMTGEFGVREIEKQIKLDDPASSIKRASISSTLKRMAEDEGEREIVRTGEGKGKRASKYRKRQ